MSGASPKAELARAEAEIERLGPLQYAMQELAAIQAGPETPAEERIRAQRALAILIDLIERIGLHGYPAARALRNLRNALDRRAEGRPAPMLELAEEERLTSRGKADMQENVRIAAALALVALYQLRGLKVGEARRKAARKLRRGPPTTAEKRFKEVSERMLRGWSTDLNRSSRDDPLRLYYEILIAPMGDKLDKPDFEKFLLTQFSVGL